MNKSPKMLENAVFRYDCVFYKTNVTCDILRPVEDDWEDDDFHRDTTWSVVKRSVDSLVTSPLYGHDLDTDSELGQLGLELHEMYLPTSIGIEALDRVRLSTHEYFNVETVKIRRYDGVVVIELGEDTRTMASTTTTSSSTTSSSTTTSTTTTTSP